ECIKLPPAVLQHPACPVAVRAELNERTAGIIHDALARSHFVDEAARSDDVDRWVDLAHRIGEQIVLDHVLIERHMAELPMTIHLVPHVPIANFVGLWMSVGGTNGAPFR